MKIISIVRHSGYLLVVINTQCTQCTPSTNSFHLSYDIFALLRLGSQKLFFASAMQNGHWQALNLSDSFTI